MHAAGLHAAIGALALLLQPCQLARATGGCPLGYVFRKGRLGKGGKATEARFLEECIASCDLRSECHAVEFDASGCKCMLHGPGILPVLTDSGNSSFCQKQSAAVQKLLLNGSEYREQEGAHIEAGGEIRLYAVGSSSVLWMTWVNQLHFALLRLGYKVPVVPPKMVEARFNPSSVQTCADSKYFQYLKTPRFGKIGWNSWDFAYDDWSDCSEDGYRNISNHKVRCEHGPGCRFGRQLFKLSDIAADAAMSNVTLLATWFNDPKQVWTHWRCWDGERIALDKTTEITVPMLRKMVRAIHAKNPHVWVIIVGKYPPARGVLIEPGPLRWLRTLNTEVAAALEQEPRTLFVDYQLPGDGVEIFQHFRWGHPNCRGSKLMVNAILERLFQAKVLARSIRLGDENIKDPDCSRLGAPDCQSAALCWVNPEDGRCLPYGPGSSGVVNVGPPLHKWALKHG